MTNERSVIVSRSSMGDLTCTVRRHPSGRDVIRYSREGALQYRSVRLTWFQRTDDGPWERIERIQRPCMFRRKRGKR